MQKRLTYPYTYDRERELYYLLIYFIYKRRASIFVLCVCRYMVLLLLLRFFQRTCDDAKIPVKCKMDLLLSSEICNDAHSIFIYLMLVP